MNYHIDVKKIEPKDWKQMAENAHLTVFNEGWDKEMERISFSLLMVAREVDTVISYATIQEIAPDHAYVQYGGAFPSFKGSTIVYKSFVQLMNYLKANYKKITTLVENTNYPMLKFYMTCGFAVTGIRYFKGSTFLENSYACA